MQGLPADGVEEGLSPDPEGARRLEAALAARGGRLVPVDYWPDLVLIGCWKGGTVGHYIDKLDAWFDPDGSRPIPVRDWGYLSSEARGSVPLSDDGSAGVLTVASNVFEFVEVDQLAAAPDDWASWDIRRVDQLEDGREYYVLLTTTGGLYRYDINDIVRAEGRYNATPRIVFVRKGRGVTNLTGEKVSVNQVIEAFQAAGRAVGEVAAHFKAEADAGRSCYVFKAEFLRELPEATLHGFLEALESRLQELNIEYKGKRASQRLGDPELWVMRPGWYERARREHVAAGKRMFQAKTELLAAMPDVPPPPGEVLAVVAYRTPSGA